MNSGQRSSFLHLIQEWLYLTVIDNTFGFVVFESSSSLTVSFHSVPSYLVTLLYFIFLYRYLIVLYPLLLCLLVWISPNTISSCNVIFFVNVFVQIFSNFIFCVLKASSSISLSKTPLELLLFKSSAVRRSFSSSDCTRRNRHGKILALLGT